MFQASVDGISLVMSMEVVGGIQIDNVIMNH
jgi:hypothetical protein